MYKFYKLAKQLPKLQKCLHPNPKLQQGWLSLQWGMLLHPLNGLLAAFPLAFGMFTMWWQHWQKITSDRLSQVFLYFCGWFAITCLWSLNPLQSVGGAANYIPFILFFLPLRLVLSTTEQLRRLAWIIVTGSIFNAVLGLGQNFWNWSKQVNLSVMSLALKEPDTLARMTASFTHANFFASYLVIALILGIVLWCEAWQQNSGKQWQTPQKLAIALLSISILLNLVCLFYTSSRNGWLTFLLVSVALMFFYGQRWIVIALGAIASLVMAAAFAGEPIQSWLRQIVPYAIWARINGQMYPEPYANSRVGIWQYAWELVQQKPWTGWGLQTFPQLYEAHAQIYLGHAHNLFLTLSMEVGIPTTLMLVGLIGWIMFQSVKNLMLASSSDRPILLGYILCFSALIMFNIVDVTLFEPRLNMLAWIFLAALSMQGKPIASKSNS